MTRSNTSRVQPQHADGPAGGGGRPGAAAAFVGWWIVLAALWLALADKAELAEICAAVVAGAIAAAAAVGTRAQREVIPRPRVRWLARLAAPVATFPRDLWLLVRALALALRGRAPAGELLDVPFDTAEDPPGTARRMLAAAGGSLTPNTVVTGFDTERGAILVHRLLPAGEPHEAADPMGLREP